MIKDPAAVPLRRTPSTAARFAAALLVCILLLGAGAGVGFEIGKRQNPVVADKADLTNFWKAWNIIDQKFYGDTSADKRVNGAITGMVAGLGDPYTVYLDPTQNKIFTQDLQGSFGGIGAELQAKNGQLVIQSVLDGTPSQTAGLLPGDVILKIDGKDTGKMTFNEAINSIRGDKGSKVVLSIGRAGKDKALDITVTRDVITVQSVKTDSLGKDKSVAYIKVNQFGQDTADAFRTALNQAVADNKKGIIIDLRNNPGGYLNAALDMIGMVLPKTTDKTEQPLVDHIGVTEKGKKGDDQLPASTEAIVPTLPITVLVNAGSASASEIFSGAMKDYARAKVIGVKTFGKGSVQELTDLGNGGSIKVTVAKWFTPLGTGIDGTGIEPDIKVELPADTTDSKDDVQVQKALEILGQK
jgi:carboxyl-terminal processing protease